MIRSVNRYIVLGTLLMALITPSVLGPVFAMAAEEAVQARVLVEQEGVLAERELVAAVPARVVGELVAAAAAVTAWEIPIPVHTLVRSCFTRTTRART